MVQEIDFETVRFIRYAQMLSNQERNIIFSSNKKILFLWSLLLMASFVSAVFACLPFPFMQQ